MPSSPHCGNCMEDVRVLHNLDDEELYDLERKVYYASSPGDDRGWRCYSCGHRYEETVTLDHYFFVLKIDTILHDLYDSKQLVETNSGVTELVVCRVEKRCMDTDCYTHEFIEQECMAAALALIGT